MAPERGRLLVWGAGGHGAVVADALRAAGFQLAGFVDRDAARARALADRMRADAARGEAAFDPRDPGPDVAGVVPGIGDNAARLACYRRLQPAQCPPVVHPRATVAASVRLGPGTVVLAGAVVNAFAELGAAVIVNSAAVVEHDCVVADGAHVSSGAVLAGGVRLGEGAWIGAGATVLPGVTVGAGAIVGAGAVVLHDVAPGLTVVGTPARPVQPPRA